MRARFFINLSDEQGLAPEEAKPVEYFPEHRMIDERVPSEAVTRSCVSCHALAKPLSWRRSPEDWKLLINTHVAFSRGSTASISSARRNVPANPPPPPGTDTRAPVEQALAYLNQAGSLHRRNGPTGTRACARRNLMATGLFLARNPAKEKFFGSVEIGRDANRRWFHDKNKLTFPPTTRLSLSPASHRLYRLCLARTFYH